MKINYQQRQLMEREMYLLWSQVHILDYGRIVKKKPKKKLVIFCLRGTTAVVCLLMSCLSWKLNSTQSKWSEGEVCVWGVRVEVWVGVIILFDFRHSLKDSLLNIEPGMTLRGFPPTADKLPVGRLIRAMATCVVAKCDADESNYSTFITKGGWGQRAGGEGVCASVSQSSRRSQKPGRNPEWAQWRTLEVSAGLVDCEASEGLWRPAVVSYKYCIVAIHVWSCSRYQQASTRLQARLHANVMFLINGVT